MAALKASDCPMAQNHTNLAKKIEYGKLGKVNEYKGKDRVGTVKVGKRHLKQ